MIDKEIARLEEPKGNGQAAYYAFSPGGLLLAEARQETILLYQPRTGKLLRRFGGGAAFRSLQFSADGKRLLAKHDFRGSDNEAAASLWDVETGTQLRRFFDHNSWMAGPILSPDARMLALAGGPQDASDSTGAKHASDKQRTQGNPPVSLWEVASGRVRHRFPGGQQHVTAIAFAPDGRHFITSGVDTTVLVWDVFAPSTGAPAGKLGLRALESLWLDLADTDAAKAYRAMCILTAKPGESAPFLGNRLKPAQAPDAKTVERFVADLGSDKFSVRSNAERALEFLAEQAGVFLRRALRNRPSLEGQKRIEGLLTKLNRPITDGQRLRPLRAVEVLEHIGTAAAQEQLRALAKGDPESWLTQDSRSSLGRCVRR